MRKTHFAISELLEMGLEILPNTMQGLYYKAKKENWLFRETPCQGGKGGVKREYALPPAVLDAIWQRRAAAAVAEGAYGQPEPCVAGAAYQGEVLDAGRLNGSTAAQRGREGARIGVLRLVERIMAESGCGKEAAITTLLTMAQMPNDDYAQARLMLRLANDARGGGGALPSSRTIMRWFAAEKAGSLMPKVPQANAGQPEWFGRFLAVWQTPQKLSVQAAYEVFARGELGREPAAALPSVHQVRRLIEKMPELARQKGRMGARALKSKQGFVRRGWKHLLPLQVVCADGQCFDAECGHPDNPHAPIRPEITLIVDVGTRRVVGFGMDLAESGRAVRSAMVQMMTTFGVADAFYADNGKGYTNKLLNDEATGLLGRVGMTLHLSAPYSSQARGVIERLHKTILVKAAKRMPTYIGKDMDGEASRAVHKATRKAQKAQLALAGRDVPAEWAGVPALANIASTKPRLLPTFAECRALIAQAINEYNNTPHRSMEMVLDVSGAARRKTPNECWAEKWLLMPEGERPMPVAADEQMYLFLPQVVRRFSRCEVRLRNNIYFNAALADWEGKEVRVAYNEHDARFVWLFDEDGRYIGRMEWNANQRDFFPKSVLLQDKEKRVDAQIKRHEGKIALLDGTRGAPVLEHASSVDLGGLRLDGAQLKAQAEVAMAAMVRVSDGAAGDGKVLKLGRQPEKVAATAEAEDWQVPTLPNAQYAAYNRLKALPYEALSAAQQGFLAWCESPKGQLVMRECAELEQMLKFG